MSKFYVVERLYAGPNPEQNLNFDTIGIYTQPARGNSSGEVKLDGWCGNTDDISEYAHGEFETREIAALHLMTIRDVRETELPEHDDECVALYKIGKFEKMSLEESWDWCISDMTSAIGAEATDKELKEFVRIAGAEAKDQGYELSPDLLDKIVEVRDEMLSDLVEDEA